MNVHKNLSRFVVTGTLPSGVVAGFVHSVVAVPAADELHFATTRAGTPLGFIDAGSGVHTMEFGGREDNIVIEDDERADFDSSRITAVEL